MKLFITTREFSLIHYELKNSFNYLNVLVFPFSSFAQAAQEEGSRPGSLTTGGVLGKGYFLVSPFGCFGGVLEFTGPFSCERTSRFWNRCENNCFSCVGEFNGTKERGSHLGSFAFIVPSLP